MKALYLNIILIFLIYSVQAQTDEINVSFKDLNIQASSLEQLELFFKENNCSGKDFLAIRNSKDQYSEQNIIALQQWLNAKGSKIDFSIYHPNSKLEIRENHILLRLRDQDVVLKVVDPEVIQNEKASQASHVQDYISDNTQKHKIDPTENNAIVLDQGTIIKIPAFSLIDENGKLYLKTVRLETLEIMTTKDAILSGTTTNYGEEFLESRGMLKIECFKENDEPLFIEAHQEIEISVPQQKEDTEGFEIFRSSLEEENSEWILEDEIPLSFRYSGLDGSRLIWSRMSNEELARNERSKEIRILAMKGSGKSPSLIKKKLKKSRKYVHRKHRKNRRKAVAAYPEKEKYLKRNAKMILGDAKFAWHLDTIIKTRSNITGFYNYPVQSFGMYNIDFIYKINKPRQQLFVSFEKDHSVKLFFTDKLVLLSGVHNETKYKFDNIPIDQSIILISSKDLDEDHIELGY